jgi:erythronate-4-phosphate dehydrogenase
VSEQRAAFDVLRKNYPSRREIDGLQVRIDGDAPQLHKIVAALGATAVQ